MRPLIILFFVGGFSSSLAAQELTLQQVLVVGKKHSDTSWSERPIEARLDEEAELSLIGVAKQGKKTIYLADEKISSLTLKKREIAEDKIVSWSTLGEIEVRWSYVEPKLRSELEKPAKKGRTTEYYTNVVADGKKIGKWLGYDEIVYFETEAAAWSKEGRFIPASAAPPRERDNLWGGLGTMRYKAEVRLTDGTSIASPGAEAYDAYGMKPSVFRVSVRKDDSYLGYMTAFFNVPYVFGSAGGQTDRYVGADCADALVGALRSKGVKIKYSFVAGLNKYADTIEKPHFIDANGQNTGDPITNAKIGDIIRINYSERENDTSPRSWDHVGLWYEDRSDPNGPAKGGPDGLFDGFDLMMHMSYPYLTIEPFLNRSPATIDILRWKKKVFTEE